MATRTEKLNCPGYENVVYAENTDVGLRAIISVHNTNRGPACGGTRLMNYASRDQALEDVLRLSRGMSYKSAMAQLAFGGGKSVIICDPEKKTPALFQEFGKFVESFGGKYIAAKDMNTGSEELLEVKKNTKHVLGIEGEPGSSGDPSPVTARGVFRALEATVESINGSRSVSGLHVSIQGLGHVGYRLAEQLHRGGAKLTVCDVSSDVLNRAVDQLGAEVVSPDAIYDVDCDLFAPCAMGGILNSETIPRLKCQAVVGGANNQLRNSEDGQSLESRGIVYAPDYVVNAGGIINVYQEFVGYDQAKALQLADGIYNTLLQVYSKARALKKPPFVVADTVAEERLAKPLGK